MPPLAPPPEASFSVDNAYRYCRKLCRRHYENFPVASRWIRRDLQGPVAAIYAFARTADDFADEPGLARDERLTRLTDWRRRLHAPDPGGHPVFVALADTIRRYELPLEPFGRLISAFERDVLFSRHPTFEDLLFYCRHSANPVGELVLRLHRAWTPQNGRWSDAICTGLQLANFWQDVTVDARIDRIYIPQQDLMNFGVTEEQVLKGPFSPALKEVMARQVGRTWTLFNAGRPLVNEAPPGLRRELRLVWLGGREILRKIERQHYNVWKARPRLSGWDWLRIGLRLLGGGHL